MIYLYRVRNSGFDLAAADRRYLRTRAAAQYLGVAESTLIAWRREKRGPASIKISCNRTLYDVQVLDVFMLGQTQRFEESQPVAAEQPTKAAGP